MIFLTRWFWIFFALVLPVHLFLANRRSRLLWILLTSVVFQVYFAGPRGIPFIFLLEAVTYFGAKQYGRTGNRRWLHGAIALDVSGLVFFKYLDFFAGYVFQALKIPLPSTSVLGALHLPVPLGISFFVFEFVHYLVEVERGMAPAKSWLRFWVFASFFPSMVSGPIKRFPDFDRQLDELARPGADDAMAGLTRIIVGAFKKIVLAEPCHAFAVWFVANPGHYPLSALLLALSLQIYFDFAGYSDIAIGISRVMGLAVPENFDNPYFCRDISDFWRRWHMSLSTWIRDYIYIPLGGNRVSVPRKIANAAVAMFLCGLWHGAAFHFGLWGLWHAFLLALHGATANIRRKLGFGGKPGKDGGRRPWTGLAGAAGYRAFTLCAVAGGWLLFFYDVPTMIGIVKATPRFLW